ncbi:MAG: hypothetical protein ACFCUX_09195 [Candidatus Methylacidiphilales bacterium]
MSCSGSNEKPYYYSDPAPVGPDGQSQNLENPNTDPNQPYVDPTVQDNQSAPNTGPTTYTQRRPVSSEPKPWASGTTQTAPTVQYPTGTKISGKTGLVKSPYAPYAGDVDVKDIPAGTTVKCPYTGKIFIVP